MKEVYLAYFDFMGFKQFIENNEDKVLVKRMNQIFIDIETALGQGNFQEPREGVVLNDLSYSVLKCLNISDTVIFWTNDYSIESLKSLIQVSYNFNWSQIDYNFPVRGALVKGMIKEVSVKQINAQGGSYTVECLYGKGLIKAHNKAESQNWAGTVVDQSVVDDLTLSPDGISFLENYAIKYRIPYKTGICDYEEYALRLVRNLTSDISIDHILERIDDVFSQDNKSVDDDSVQTKILNTKYFLKFLVDK